MASQEGKEGERVKGREGRGKGEGRREGRKVEGKNGKGGMVRGGKGVERGKG